ncbi:MAG: helix-turn-helix domain-containing protein [Oscillospiraceae bacterium]
MAHKSPACTFYCLQMLFLNIDRTSYVKYETGKNYPAIDTLMKLAEYFDVSIDYLLTGENSSSPLLEDKSSAADFGKRLFAAHGDIAPEDFSQDDIGDVAMFLQLKKMKKVKKDDD